jgi:hypothetical protein
MADWTVKEYADRERVDEKTVRRWVERGAVPARRTPGGQIRILNPDTGQTRTSPDISPTTLLRRR